MDEIETVIVGGGAAGFFAAITAGELGQRVLLLERGSHFLSKVKISGGGRCNVTHHCFDPRILATCYPRGSRALLSIFSKFQPKDVITWFQKRGVYLKTESDGRMFPATNSSQTIIDCLFASAQAAGVEMRLRCGVDAVVKSDSHFILSLSDGKTIRCEKVLLATGGCRSGSGSVLAEGLGHTLESPVPSLFSFHIKNSILKTLPGISVAEAGVRIPGTKLQEKGALLITHTGVS